MRLSLPILIAALGASASARPGSSLKERGTASIQAYTSWQLRLFNAAEPTCDPNTSNVNLSIYTRSGRYGRACETFSPADTNDGSVPKSLSFKTVEGDAKDFCMFSTSNCTAGTLIASITSGWEMCYPYNGFVAYSVVEHGDPCV
ncbi:hypothetical protein N7509_005145 [Penicillium cosmopolitanum]|uniref:AA1-like domain-containing protein n=1 Tax=Penicillium cosmopolitanum TaxID=1131564 RepID=A0A9W9W1V3_9EURO|nr:uncharacterized protein N7509_005145 [Penicillium cosmopolitanum]KAJ5397032.1 hypothetical protein N7509_005145 [Penicillium cosmopolitanum]